MSKTPEGDLKGIGVQRVTRVVSLETRVVSLANLLACFVILLVVVCFHCISSRLVSIWPRVCAFVLLVFAGMF